MANGEHGDVCIVIDVTKAVGESIHIVTRSVEELGFFITDLTDGCVRVVSLIRGCSIAGLYCNRLNQ